MAGTAPQEPKDRGAVGEQHKGTALFEMQWLLERADTCIRCQTVSEVTTKRMMITACVGCVTLG